MGIGFVRRVIDFRAMLMEHVPGDPGVSVYAVVCNGCGKSVIANTPEQLAGVAAAWSLSEVIGGDDLCPGCVACA